MSKLAWRSPDKPNRIYSLRYVKEGDYLAQVKKDGHNAVVIKDGGEVRIWSRTEKPLRVSPWLVESIRSLDLADGDVLNGEWTGLRKADREEGMHFYGWMFSKYEWLGSLDEEERYKRLLDLREAKGVAVLKSVTEGYGDLYRSTVDDWATEGIVLKNRKSKLIGNRSESAKNQQWLKLKWRDGADGAKIVTVPDEELVCL